MPTAPMIHPMNPDGRDGLCTALLDTGAPCNFMTKDYFDSVMSAGWFNPSQPTNANQPFSVNGIGGSKVTLTRFIEIPVTIFGIRVTNMPFLIMDKLKGTKYQRYSRSAPVFLGASAFDRLLADFVAQYGTEPFQNLKPPAGFSKVGFAILLLTYNKGSDPQTSIHTNNTWYRMPDPASNIPSETTPVSLPSEAADLKSTSSDPSTMPMTTPRSSPTTPFTPYSSSSSQSSIHASDAASQPDFHTWPSELVSHRDIHYEDIAIGSAHEPVSIPPKSWRFCHTTPKTVFRGLCGVFPCEDCQLPQGCTVIFTSYKAKKGKRIPLIIQNMTDEIVTFDSPIKVASVHKVEEFKMPTAWQFSPDPESGTLSVTAVDDDNECWLPTAAAAEVRANTPHLIEVTRVPCASPTPSDAAHLPHSKPLSSHPVDHSTIFNFETDPAGNPANCLSSQEQPHSPTDSLQAEPPSPPQQPIKVKMPTPVDTPLSHEVPMIIQDDDPGLQAANKYVRKHMEGLGPLPQGADIPVFGPDPDWDNFNFDQEIARLPMKMPIGAVKLTLEQQKRFLKIIYENKQVFSLHDGDLGYCDKLVHTIPTTTDEPITLPHRTINPSIQAEVRKCLDTWLAQGVIRRSCSPYASQTVLVRKKTGELRICVDYRKLNNISRKDAFPLPRIDDALQAVQGAKMFSSIDLAQGYLQLKMNPSDIQKTAFRAGSQGFFEFTRMPFGLCNAGASFCRMMELCLGDQQYLTMLLYIDDVCIFAATANAMLDHIELLFKRLIGFNLKIKPKKCTWFQKEVKYLGHVLTEKGVKTDPDKVRKIKDWPVPQNETELRSFLGLASYYRRFIPKMSSVAAPLFDMLKPPQAPKRSKKPLKIKFEWTPACQVAFENLKLKLIKAPILVTPQFDKPFILETDASNKGLGAVLSQIQDDGKRHVIAFASRGLRPNERNMRNYSSAKLEFLALKWAICDKFKDYLRCSKFIVYTDNNPLTHIQSHTGKLGAAQVRWSQDLASFDFDIVYKKGSNNVVADALSRRPVNPDSPLESEQSESTFGDLLVVAAATISVNTADLPKQKTVKIPARCVHEVLSTASGSTPLPLPLVQRANDVLSQKLVEAHTQASPSCVHLVSPAPPSMPSMDERDWSQDRPSPTIPATPNADRTPYRTTDQQKILHPVWEPMSPSAKYSAENIALAQQDDQNIAFVYKMVKGQKPPAKTLISKCGNKELRTLMSMFPRLVLRKNCLHRVVFQNNEECFQLVLPVSMRRDALQLLHDQMGHQSYERTFELVRERFFWPSYASDVHDFVSTCKRCIVAKGNYHEPKVSHGSLINTRPLETLYVDFTVLDKSKSGRENVLVMTDGFTKFTQAVVTTNQSAPTVAKALVDHWFYRFGIPERIHSDQGKSFDNKIVKALCTVYGVKYTSTAPYNPRGNAQCERFNRTLHDLLRTLPAEDKKNWPRHIQARVFAYNATVHSTTGFQPYHLMFGRKAPTPCDAWMGLHQFQEHPVQHKCVWLTEHFELLEAAIQQAFDRSQAKKKKAQIRAGGDEHLIPLGNIVHIRYRPKGRNKIQDKFEEEPWIVVSKPDHVQVYNVRLLHHPRSKPKRYHRRELHDTGLTAERYLSSLSPVEVDKLLDKKGNLPKLTFPRPPPAASSLPSTPSPLQGRRITRAMRKKLDAVVPDAAPQASTALPAAKQLTIQIPSCERQIADAALKDLHKCSSRPALVLSAKERGTLRTKRTKR